MGMARDHSSTMGVDERGLGRWSWVRLSGREGVAIRIVSCYRPTYNPNYPGSTWSQQRAFFDDINIDRDPCEQFFRDLFRELQKWTATGDHIILGIDLNDDVRKPLFRERFAKAGLTEALTHKHHQEGVPTSNTGSERAMPQFRRLRLDDPRTVKRYHTLLTKQLLERDLPQRSSDLWDTCQQGVTLSRQQAFAFESINQEYLQSVGDADRHCRRIRQGTVDRSPAYAHIRYRILYWQRVLRRRTRPNARYLQHTAKRAGIVYEPAICSSLTAVKEKLKEAYADNAQFKRHNKKLATQVRDDGES